MNTTVDEKSLETMIGDHGDDLCHYGVANQKWGQRKYQYMDGRLTPLGRLHYGIGFKNIGQVEAARRAKAKAEKEKAEAKERKRAEDVDRVTRTGSAEEIYKMRESMTDAELTRAVQRMNATKQLEQALAQSANVKLSKASEPKKMSFFEKQKAKKAEKEAKDAAEKAEKEKKAQEAINKGLQVLETATKVTNTVAGTYESYNKIASMINEVGGTSLPTFSSQPWNKKNPSKNEQIIKTGDASKILESSTGMSNEELSNAAKRLTSLKVIKGHVSDGGSSKTTDTEPQAEKKAETKQSSSTDSDKAYQSLMSMLDSDFGTLNGSSGSSVSNSKPSSMPKTDSDKAYKEVMSMMESWGGQKVPDDPFSVLEDIMKHFDMNGGETMESWIISRDEDVICHYGIKGMKWHKHLFRKTNSDGSLTIFGKMGKKERQRMSALEQEKTYSDLNRGIGNYDAERAIRRAHDAEKGIKGTESDALAKRRSMELRRGAANAKTMKAHQDIVSKKTRQRRAAQAQANTIKAGQQNVKKILDGVHKNQRIKRSQTAANLDAVRSLENTINRYSKTKIAYSLVDTAKKSNPYSLYVGKRK